MAKDHSLALRRGLVSALNADTAFKAASSGGIFGEKAPSTPSYPLTRVGMVIPRGFEATGLEGMRAVVNIDCISNAADASEAYTLAQMVVDLLDQQTPDLPGDAAILSIDWTGTTPRKEGARYRQMIGFSITTQSSTE